MPLVGMNCRWPFYKYTTPLFLCNLFFHHHHQQTPITNHISTLTSTTNLHSIDQLRSSISSPHPQLKSHNNGIQTNPIPCLLPHPQKPDPRRTSFRTQHIYSASPHPRQLNPHASHCAHRNHICPLLSVSVFSPLPICLLPQLTTRTIVLCWVGPGWQPRCSEKQASDS